MLRQTARNGAVSYEETSLTGSEADLMTDLGKANTMPMATAGGNALVTISYWKDIEHLHAFAQGSTHRVGWDWFVFLQPIIPLSKRIESPETLSRDSRAPPESIVLIWINTTGGLRRTISIPTSVSCMKRTLCRKDIGKTYIKTAIP